jgi:iron complex transport system substrate-binding protein
MRVYLRYLTYLLFLGILMLTFISAHSTNMDVRIISPKQQIEDCRVVQHEMGETCIPLHPQRVVTLWISTLRTTLALGIKPVASTYIPGEPFPKHLQDQVDSVEFVGTVNEPNLEKILRLKPDLILANSRLQNIYQQLSYIAPTVVMNLPSPPPSWMEQLEDLAKILQKKKVRQQLINEYWQRIEKLKFALGTSAGFSKENSRSQIQVSVATLSPGYGIWAYGAKHPVSILLNDIGLQRPPSQKGDFDVTSAISEENLSDIDGDVIFFLYWGNKDANKALESLQQKPLWQQLKAVQKNRVYFVDGAHWYGFDILAMNAVMDDLFKYLVNTP